MPAYAQLVVGPAGSGKSTYCHMMQQHFQVLGRSCRGRVIIHSFALYIHSILVVNLDPAAEQYQYEAEVDIRELISIEDVMDDEELRLGPNGGLVFCMEYLTENFEWLKENMDPQGKGASDSTIEIFGYQILPILGRLSNERNSVGQKFRCRLSIQPRERGCLAPSVCQPAHINNQLVELSMQILNIFKMEFHIELTFDYEDIICE